MKPTYKITDPNWQDLLDRDERIAELGAELADSVTLAFDQQAENARLWKMVDAQMEIEAENERLRSNAEAWNAWKWILSRPESKVMKANAERYRWLLNQGLIEYADCEDGETWASMNWIVGPASLSPETLDAAIDAAMEGGVMPIFSVVVDGTQYSDTDIRIMRERIVELEDSLETKKESYAGLYREYTQLKAENERLLVLVTKWCDKDHHDWQEILKIGGGT